MRKHYLIVYCLCLLLTGYLIAQEEGSEQLGEVEITGEAKDKITIGKITPEIKIKIEDIVDSVTDKTEKLLEKGKPVPSEEDFEQFSRLASRQTAHPWLAEFAEPPLISFFPSISETTVKAWRLEVTDEQGNIIKTIRGRGNPVKKIVWDGRDKKDKIIKAGKHYSYRFITVDEFKISHTTLGRAFSLTNLRHRDRKNIYLEIENDFFFDEDRIRPEAGELFNKVIDILREYSNYPFTVEFHTNDPRSELVKKRQLTVTRQIAHKMLLLSEDVRYSYPKIGKRGDIIRFVIQRRKI